MNEIDAAMQCFENKYNCCQSVVVPFASHFGISHDHANKIAAAFGGGIGHMGETCGAVSGGCMVLGLLSGKKHDTNPDLRNYSYDLAGEFIQQFETRVGALKCRELIGIDISIPEEYQRAREENVFHTRCPNFIKTAVELLQEMIKKYEGLHSQH